MPQPNLLKARKSQSNFKGVSVAVLQLSTEPRFQRHEHTVLTHAAVSAGLPRVSRGADAHVGADQVLAGHAFAGAVVQSGFTLVVVWRRTTRQV